MIRKIFIIIIAVVLVASACAVPAHAVDFGNYSDGWEQTGINNSVHNLAEAWRILRKVKTQEISVPEAAAQIVGMGWTGSFENIFAFVNELITTGDINVMTPHEFVTAVGNAINNEISNNGGNVSNFPLANGGYWQVGNFTFKPVSFSSGVNCINAGFSPSFNAYYTYLSSESPCSGVVPYWPDGTPYKNTTSFFILGDVGTSNTLTIDNIDVAFERTVNVYVTYTVHFSINGSSKILESRDRIAFDYQDWGDYNGDDLSYITDTPDLNNLNDDDLLKYIDNVINKLDETFPDLSTIEGKLQEVINLLNKLQSGGCNCNELAEAVYSLLSYLQDNGNGNVDNDLRDVLFELKNLLKYDINLDPIKNRLDDIYDVLSDISFKLDEDATAETVENDIQDSYEKFKKKVEDKFQITTIKRSINNFTSCVFGKVAFENDSATGQLMVASVYGDGSRSVSDIFYPLSLEFEYDGVTYDLFEWSGFIPATTMSTFRSFVRFIIWITFLIGLFRSLPGIIGGFGSVTAPVDKQLTSKFEEGYGD